MTGTFGGSKAANVLEDIIKKHYDHRTFQKVQRCFSSFGRSLNHCRTIKDTDVRNYFSDMAYENIRHRINTKISLPPLVKDYMLNVCHSRFSEFRRS